MSLSSITIVASLPEFPSVGESVAYQLNGLIVVLFALGTIWGILEVIGFGFKRAAARAAAEARAGAALPVTAEEQAPPAGPTPLTLVLIAAAVHATLGRHARVRAIQPAESSVHWAQEGRRQIFASHKVR